jgi:ubiquinone/menaquinone biosynthesis C-methylase UbiE
MNFFEKFFVNRLNQYRVPQKVLSLLEHAKVRIEGFYLELGAGLGYTACTVYDKFHPGKIVITDFDVNQVEGSRSLVKQRYDGIPAEFEFHQADVLQLSFEDQSFDFVMSTLMFHHVERNRFKFIKTPMGIHEIQRILKPNGIFFFWDIYHLKQVDGLFAPTDYKMLVSTNRQRIYQKL